MKVNELRIGNYVLENGKNIKQVTGILNDAIFTNSAGVQIVNPIPLTEQWLLDLGFTIINFNGIEAIKENIRYSVKSIDGYDGYLICDGDTVLTNLKYVHRFQNLWYELTNIELTL